MANREHEGTAGNGAEKPLLGMPARSLLTHAKALAFAHAI